jgi:hypothetical protein
MHKLPSAKTKQKQKDEGSAQDATCASKPSH